MVWTMTQRMYLIYVIESIPIDSEKSKDTPCADSNRGTAAARTLYKVNPHGY